jgi:hypothetical protein
LAAIGIFAGAAWADLITYVETTTATGSLGGTAFTNASVTVTLTGDTSNIAPGPAPFGAFLVNPGSATIRIDGLPLATFTDPVEIAGSFNQPTPPSPWGVPLVLIATLDNPAGTDITGVVVEYGDPAFLGYGLGALGPISATGGSASGPGGSHNTTRGVLLFSSDQNPQAATFTATVVTPEPNGVPWFGGVLLSLIGLRKRLKRT